MLEAALRATRRLDVPGCFAELAEGARRVTGAAWVLAYDLAPDGEGFECRAVAGDGPAAAALRELLGALDARVAALVPSGRPEVVERAADLLPPRRDLPPLGPAIALSLGSETRPQAFVLCIAAPGQQPSRRGLARLAALAREVGPALENLRQIEALRALVIRDDVADCFNRRHLDTVLADEVERARRFGSRFALIFVDTDNLKDLNTEHGHAAGSQALHEASVRMARTIRSIDRLFRYGGDEFVVLLPGTDLEGAREVAERIRREVAREPIALPGGRSAELTVSAGVAAWPDHGTTAAELIEAADAALRAVKERGKNAVAVAAGRGESSP
ncbi:MAG: GGDEF domain-containing protein [Acidobacteria bacterium]|nr:MAG: GGDEF domain-containing protein [Acidobacteriota bacterium]